MDRKWKRRERWEEEAWQTYHALYGERAAARLAHLLQVESITRLAYQRLKSRLYISYKDRRFPRSLASIALRSALPATATLENRLYALFAE